jgi:hypothetical protein
MVMRLKNVFGMLLSLLTLAIVGCGGGGGSDGPGGTSVSGSAVKGPISGATVQAFEIISSASVPRENIPRIGTAVIATGATTADGSFSFAIPPAIKNGGILFKLTGGTYRDEATGQTRNVNDQAAGGLRAVFGNISGVVRRGETLKVNINPFTELGVQSLGSSAPTDANIAAANARVVSTFGLTGIDLLSTRPFDATTAPPAGATQAQKNYALALAILSQRQKDGGITLDQLHALLLPDVNAGVLSGANGTAGSVALLNFLNTGTNLSGGTVAPVDVIVTPTSPTTAAINTAVTLTASVTLGGSPVPNGTEVKFAIKSGVGGTLSAASATTTGGAASVTLSSATDTAAYVVTATAGGHSADTALITFADPNKPGSITLTANPATGVINGQTPVTLTATVNAAGGPGFTVPVGTVVTFLSSGGELTAATSTNSSGVATATLNSAAVGAFDVSARAGAAPVVTSNVVSVPFIAQPTVAIVKVTTTGTLPVGTLIGGIEATVTANPSSGLSIAPSPTGSSVDVSYTGVAVGSLPVVNSTNVAAVGLAPISIAGFGVGEFATLTYHISAGTFPVAGNFGVGLTGAGVINPTGGSLPGIGVSILSVTIQ